MESLVLSMVLILGHHSVSFVCDTDHCSQNVSYRSLSKISKGSIWQEVRVCGPNGCEKIRVMAPEQPTMFKGKRYKYRAIVAGSCNISIKYHGLRGHGFWRVRYGRHKGR